jgi:hypothetical protein
MRRHTEYHAHSPQRHAGQSASYPDPERIRVRAYELWEKRHGGEGDQESDWYRAEKELQDPSRTLKS